MRTKTMSLVAVGMILMAAIIVSYLISKPALFVSQKSMPVFMGEEIIIQKTGVRAVKALKEKTAVKADKAVKAMRVASVPMPQPKVAVPLPILPPSISYRLLPQYPMSALEQGLQGTAILSIYIGSSGAAEMVNVKSSSGVAELDNSAVSAVSKWKFSPASRGGAAVASWFELPVRFEIN